jgi:hypothetical protein
MPVAGLVGEAGGFRDTWRKKLREGARKKRYKWVRCKGHKSLFTLLFKFNTVSAENKLKFHFRKKLKFRYSIGKKILIGLNSKADFKMVSNKKFSHYLATCRYTSQLIFHIPCCTKRKMDSFHILLSWSY